MLFSLSVNPGTTQADKDFIIAGSDSLHKMTFFPGDKIELNISLVDDKVTEKNETFSVLISSTDPDVNIVNGTATIIIVDNDGKLSK